MVCILYLGITQFRFTTFQLLESYTWLVASVSNNEVLNLPLTNWVTLDMSFNHSESAYLSVKWNSIKKPYILGWYVQLSKITENIAGGCSTNWSSHNHHLRKRVLQLTTLAFLFWIQLVDWKQSLTWTFPHQLKQFLVSHVTKQLRNRVTEYSLK